MKTTEQTRERENAAAALRNELAHFTGSEQFFRHGLLPRIRYTEGVQYLAEKAGAYWLLDKIAAEQLAPPLQAEHFQVWKLRVAGSKGAITVTDGDDRTIYEEQLDFTDFPLDQFSIWLVDGMILLPSEY
jgi:hypothetical protein